MPESERLLTVEELADWLQVKPRTIYQWVHEQYIPVIKLGSLVRFNSTSISAWIRKREAPGRAARKIGIQLNDN